MKLYLKQLIFLKGYLIKIKKFNKKIQYLNLLKKKIIINCKSY